ncbi:hypothetical protein ARMGADRAFT_1087852 [Armillaria gallica]|uniref:Uncharacterized protein n=1 Tax=Armillaria gallica TaxID=47427 RepID=A0A2H3CPE7_ARMGA|nr:hypothetical protein ARMGADRAFT_1087852 [Armillaria gallica]
MALDSSGHPTVVFSLAQIQTGLYLYAEVLSFDLNVSDGDHSIDNASDSEDIEMLIASIGVKFSTHRRKNFVGKITKTCTTMDTNSMSMSVKPSGIFRSIFLLQN